MSTGTLTFLLKFRMNRKFSLECFCMSLKILAYKLTWSHHSTRYLTHSLGVWFVNSKIPHATHCEVALCILKYIKRALGKNLLYENKGNTKHSMLL